MPADSDHPSMPPAPPGPDLLEQVREQERLRLARDLHDELGGNLTAIKMALSQLSAQLPPEAMQLHARAAYLDQLLDRSFDAVHRLTSTLRARPQAAPLADGLVAALNWQARQFEQQTGVPVTLSCSAHEPALDAAQASALFFIVQEALTNIARHAGASHAGITLESHEHALRLTISDNGRGISEQDRHKPGHFGLAGIEERISAVGGTVRLSGTPGNGTILVLTLEPRAAAPVPGAEDQGIE